MLTALSGRSVMITGASKGIGKGMARVFADNGCRVLLTGRTESFLQAAVREIRTSGGTAESITADAADPEAIQEAVNFAEEVFGGLDILCCNAGIFPNTRLDKMSGDDWDTVMNTNAKGMFHSIKSAIPLLKRSDQGRIILTSSITGPVTGYPGWSHYGASKAAMLGFMRTAAIEFADSGITINAILPGNIATEGLDGLNSEYMKTMKDSISMKRLGSTDDIAFAALFFASREAGFITGQTLIIDGGQVLPESLEALS